MKNKINQFAKGIFNEDASDIVFSDTHLVITVGEGEVYHGSFQIENRSGMSIRGLVYASSVRMRLKEQGFEGNPVTISFTYNASGLEPGNVENGKFTIICNNGEYTVRFSMVVERPYVITSYGKIQRLENFRDLAMKDYAEARNLFRSRRFYEILKYEGRKVCGLYDNMRTWALDEQAMEEFLISTKQKEKIYFSLSESMGSFYQLRESKKSVFHVYKNTWGYLEAKVRVSGDFLTVNRSSFTTEDFVGNSILIEYIIDVHKLHGGMNYGRIAIETAYETLEYKIEIDQSAADREDTSMEKYMLAQLQKDYLQCCGNRKDWGEWVNESTDKMNEIRKAHPEDMLYPLIQANIYLLGERYEDSRWILDNYNSSILKRMKNMELWSYYLFLTAAVGREGTHVHRVVEELNHIYVKESNSWKLAAMILELDPAYHHYGDRLPVLEEKFYEGAHDVLFYMEALKCFRANSSLLRKLGKFEIQVLLFASKYNLMTKDLALYTANLASQLKNFDHHMFRVLTTSYEVYHEKMILMAICTLLIKGSLTDNCFFKWFELALEQDLKIAQLYEFYLAAMDERNVYKQMPKSIYLYFLHGISLDYRKRALLYANLVLHEQELPDLFEKYENKMKAFAWEQLEKRHISETLRIIYKRFFTEKDMNAERVYALNDICHGYIITTRVPNMKNVIVLDENGKIAQVTPYRQSGTLIFVHTKDDRIVWEDMNGRHYTESIVYDARRVFYEVAFNEICRKFLDMELAQAEELKRQRLTYQEIVEDGLSSMEPEEACKIVSVRVNEGNAQEDEYLLSVCYELFMSGYYDQNILRYLAKYYCGATRDMKRIWKASRKYDVSTHKLAERIITQMVFSETMYGEEEIFANYYEGGAYFRLQKAYLSYICHEYVVNDRVVAGVIFDIICREYEKKEEIPNICKIATLLYFSYRRYDEEHAVVLKDFMQMLCEEHIYFPFFMNYPESWLQEYQLWDKVMISYVGSKDGVVTLNYDIKERGIEAGIYTKEILSPMYENIYVKVFTVFEGEKLKYYFHEEIEGRVVETDVSYMKPRKNVLVGRYGLLNAITTAGRDEQEKYYKEYIAQDTLAKELYVLY